MKEIYLAIRILKRVNNCDEALNNLKQAKDNALFKGEMNLKYANHVHNLICEAIKIIEYDEDEGKE